MSDPGLLLLESLFALLGAALALLAIHGLGRLTAWASRCLRARRAQHGGR